MGENLAKLHRLRRESELDGLRPEERRALDKVQKEARAAGSTLERDGVGGIPYSLALGIYRRDKYQCKRCACRHDLGLHHKGGIDNSHWSKVGKANTAANLVVICARCHDSVHDEDRGGGPDNYDA